MSTDAGAAPGRDPGLQPQRTRLAWRRTTLSGTVVTVLAARSALGSGPSPASVAAGALCALFWLAFLRLAHLRIRTLDASHRPGALAPPHAAAAALCAVALAVCGAAIVL
ncbi:DUF202 domain-containing protein [Streptomyces sp. SCSIO 75703]|uniref:DUF202 domain-containing protein n=1 Tax=unclassified Streptomyces TaxID=2593676 RepID=UPI0004C04374|nr:MULTISPECIES: DUF202 domain-containing protein [unclassified Streptomyces]